MIALALCLPLAVVAVISFAGVLPAHARHRVRRTVAILAPLAAAPGVVLALTAQVGDPTSGLGAGPGDSAGGADAGGAEAASGGAAQTALSLSWMLFGTHFALDYQARALLLIAALLYGAALSSVSWVKLRHTERGSGALSSFLLVAYTGNIGTYMAADAVTFYLCFSLMSFSAAGLVVHYRTASAHRAARIYLVLSVLSETAILAALLLIVAAGGRFIAEAPAAVADSPHTGLVLGLLLVGFGVKAGTVPLHIWLPLAHPAAPPAASAVLSGAMVKAGLVGWLRFVPSAEPGAAEAVVAAAGWVLLAAALVGAFAAVLVGVLQDQPKVILAYSTISQMGFIAAVVAVGMIVPDLREAAAAAAVIYAVHHGLAKGALFLAVPVAAHYGRGFAGVLVAVGTTVAALAVAGAPFTSGALGKYVSKEAVGEISVLGADLEYVLALVATGSTVLLVRFGFVLARGERERRRGVDGELLSWLAVAGASVAVPWLVGVYWFTDAGLPLDPPEWDGPTLWTASWPVLLGAVLSGLVWLLAARGTLPRRLAAADGSLVAPGDLAVPEERMLKRASALATRASSGADAVSGGIARMWHGAWGAASAAAQSVAAGAEQRLGGWHVSGGVLVVIVAVGALLTIVPSLLTRGGA